MNPSLLVGWSFSNPVCMSACLSVSSEKSWPSSELDNTEDREMLLTWTFLLLCLSLTTATATLRTSPDRQQILGPLLSIFRWGKVDIIIGELQCHCWSSVLWTKELSQRSPLPTWSSILKLQAPTEENPLGIWGFDTEINKKKFVDWQGFHFLLININDKVIVKECQSLCQSTIFRNFIFWWTIGKNMFHIS